MIFFVILFTVIATIVAVHFSRLQRAREIVKKNLKKKPTVTTEAFYTPQFKRQISRVSGLTGKKARYINGNENYSYFHGDPAPPIAMARIKHCFLCGVESDDLVTEHLHVCPENPGKGVFRGPACHGCNAKERQAIFFARKWYDISKSDYESGKVSWFHPIWYLHAAALEHYLSYARSFGFCLYYVTGWMWIRRKALIE